jgi:hypothetical protein
MGTSKNLLRVALSVFDARRTSVRLCFSTDIASARDGFSRCPHYSTITTFFLESVRYMTLERKRPAVHQWQRRMPKISFLFP